MLLVASPVSHSNLLETIWLEDGIKGNEYIIRRGGRRIHHRLHSTQDLEPIVLILGIAARTRVQVKRFRHLDTTECPCTVLCGISLLYSCLLDEKIISKNDQTCCNAKPCASQCVDTSLLI